MILPEKRKRFGGQSLIDQDPPYPYMNNGAVAAGKA